MTTTDTARPTVLARLKRIFGIREMPVIVALIALIIITWVINPRFLTSQSVKDRELYRSNSKFSYFARGI